MYSNTSIKLVTCKLCYKDFETRDNSCICLHCYYRIHLEEKENNAMLSIRRIKQEYGLLRTMWNLIRG